MVSVLLGGLLFFVLVPLTVTWAVTAGVTPGLLVLLVLSGVTYGWLSRREGWGDG